MKIQILLLFVLAFAAAAAPKWEWVFVGSEKSGIYTYRLEMDTGALTLASQTEEPKDANFFAIHPNRRFLYTIDHGKKGAGVAAFAINGKTGELSFINWQPSKGKVPCHVSVDDSGRNLFVANYGSGSICAFPISSRGAIEPLSVFIQNEGSSVNRQRQEGPHAHCILPDPKNHHVLVCDLGLDKVLVYKFDPMKGTLVANDPPSASVEPGAGARHLAFSPNGQFAYVVNEMGSTLTTFRYDARRGVLTEIQNLSTLPKDFTGHKSGAEVAVHPSGKFVYASNRGQDSIAIFAIDASTGLASYVGYQLTEGKTPRNFEIDPTGTFLLAANQDSNTVVTFRINLETGCLTQVGNAIQVPSPMCVKCVAE